MPTLLSLPSRVKAHKPLIILTLRVQTTATLVKSQLTLLGSYLSLFGKQLTLSSDLCPLSPSVDKLPDPQAQEATQSIVVRV